VDSSALIAIPLHEPENARFTDAIAAAGYCRVAAVSALEASIVIEARKGPAGGRELDLLLYRARIEIVAMNGAQVEIARDAWRRFGRGNHPAALNLGDCCSYALAIALGESLLYKGGYFAQTDVRDALS